MSIRTSKYRQAGCIVFRRPCPVWFYLSSSFDNWQHWNNWPF